MRLIPLLSRVLLSACIVLYGAGAFSTPAHAHGTPHASHAQASDQGAPLVEAGNPRMDCHDAGKPDPAPVVETQDVQHDCCQSPGCSCHCSHHASAVAVFASFTAPSVRMPAPRMPSAGYTPPAGVTLNRPPIG
ncbi:MAG: CopL family metal-binding regulatory protein [Luteimonas sp.]|nr:CopL family metal-binding regulatory protein [Luteimonas sp.]